VADGGGGDADLVVGDVAVSGRLVEFDAWAFVGAGIKTQRFGTMQEAVTWASGYNEWVIYERATKGWRPVQHGGERGRIVAGALADGVPVDAA